MTHQSLSRSLLFFKWPVKMSLQALVKGFGQLRVGQKPLAFASHKNGLCRYQRLSAGKPVQAEQISATIVCAGKKMKTRKAAAKRFTVTATGKILRRRPGKQHINEKMSRAKIRKLGKKAVVEKRDMANISPNLPYSGVRQSRN